MTSTTTPTPTRRFRKLRIFAAVAVAVLLLGVIAARRIAFKHADPENLPELLAVGGPAPAFTARIAQLSATAGPGYVLQEIVDV